MKYPFIDISHILIVIYLLTRLLQTMNDKQFLLLLNFFITIKLSHSTQKKPKEMRGKTICKMLPQKLYFSRNVCYLARILLPVHVAVS